MNKISVIVCTYKPDFSKLKRTLLSIFMQKEMDVEVILADDGSNVDFSEIKSWISKKLPSNFEIKFSLLEKNVGTIKNVLSALELVTSKFVKLISPGDYLNTEYSLKKYYERLSSGDCSAVFAKAIYYGADTTDFKTINLRAPLLLKPYIKKWQNKRVLTSLCLYQDYLLGASLAYITETFKKHLQELSESGVKYGEDFSSFLFAINDEKIAYIDEYLLWYEIGLGISNSGESPLVANDKKILYSSLLPKYENIRVIKKSINYHLYRVTHSKSKSYLHLFFLSPSLFFKYIDWLFKLKSIPKKIKVSYRQEDYRQVFESEI